MQQISRRCPKCRQFTGRDRYFDLCSKCIGGERLYSCKNKGMKEYNQVINYFLRLDRSRGMSYARLARIYKLDASNIYKRVNGTLNKKPS